jgi:1,2-dihydroxy-3-keto-5-methylthiopentene dioxygenase
MSRLRIFDETDPKAACLEVHDHAAISAELAQRGIRFERWVASAPVQPGDAPDKVVSAYRYDIDRLMNEEGYQAFDVISLSPDHPDKETLRQKFLSEHTHSEDEVRFFVAGSGLFTLHLGGEVCEILCEQGDLIGVPDGTRHWFDMGPHPHFVAIRLFTNPGGWVAQFTGDNIAERFPRLEN